ncbi:hypothetical protein [Casimicrobium huifangae]|uniref:hypothetical protein n=1 Tax=Casimicrobium huifangae TaxID=2591109 RepID=UPI0037848928
MSGVGIKLNGMDDAKKQMERIQRGCQGLAQWTGYVYSRMPYAWGMEYGSHRVSGKLARRAGGQQYMNEAVSTVMTGADMDLSQGLTKVTAPGRWVIKRLALWARRLSRLNVPKETGRLRRSIKVEVRPR